MKKILFLFVFLILLVGCTKQAELSGISIQTKNETNLTKENEVIMPLVENKTNETIEKINITNITQNINQSIYNISNKTEVKVETSLMPEMNDKCRYSAIIYGGCKWKDMNKSKFELTIASAAHDLIKGVWIVVHGANQTKNIERTEDLIPEGARVYEINYAELKKEIGDISKIDILPLETINGKDYVCYNQRTSFVPSNHCKLPPIKY